MLRTKLTSAGLQAILLMSWFCTASITNAQEKTPKSLAPIKCSVDLTKAGQMSDIISNAMMHGLKKNGTEVRSFLDSVNGKFSTGQELLNATATKFSLDPAKLMAEVTKFKHCNCDHAMAGEAGYVTSNEADTVREEDVSKLEVSQFAQDVVLHVVLHELGHALIREFDLPVLGNEETMADAFATWYLTTHMPDRAVAVLKARTESLMIEASEVPRDEWTVRGEHNSDARRAYQIAGLAVAADREKYLPIANAAGMSQDDIGNCTDYGTEIHRSWRRMIQPLWLPANTDSKETRFRYDSDGKIVSQLQSGGVTKEIEDVVKRFDWHSQVTIYFAEGQGGAGWSRSNRTITVNSEYVRRFIKQGKLAK